MIQDGKRHQNRQKNDKTTFDFIHQNNYTYEEDIEHVGHGFH